MGKLSLKESFRLGEPEGSTRSASDWSLLGMYLHDRGTAGMSYAPVYAVHRHCAPLPCLNQGMVSPHTVTHLFPVWLAAFLKATPKISRCLQDLRDVWKRSGPELQ